MPNYTHDTERWLRSNAELYRRKGNQQMARNMTLCAEDVHMLKTALRAKDADYVALKEAVRPVMDGVRLAKLRRRDDVLYPVSIFDALAALVGEE